MKLILGNKYVLLEGSYYPFKMEDVKVHEFGHKTNGRKINATDQCLIEILDSLDQSDILSSHVYQHEYYHSVSPPGLHGVLLTVRSHKFNLNVTISFHTTTRTEKETEELVELLL